MPGKIFISYRREDEQGFAVRLYERLAEHFGKEGLFFDIDSIPPGFDFVDYIEKQIELCEIVLVVMGRNWLNAVDPHGRRRLENPDDFVRVEIESALKQRKHVVPILVQGTPMPLSKELPRKMQGLSRRNAFFATHVGFRSEVTRLVSGIESAFLHIEAQQSLAAPPPHKEEAPVPAKESAERVEAFKAPPTLLETVPGDASTDGLLAGELATSVAASLADFGGSTRPRLEPGRLSTTENGPTVDGVSGEAVGNRTNAARRESPSADRRAIHPPSSKVVASPSTTRRRTWLYGRGALLAIVIMIAGTISIISIPRDIEELMTPDIVAAELPGSGIAISNVPDASNFGLTGQGVMVSNVQVGSGARSVGVEAGWLIRQIGRASVNSSKAALEEYTKLVSPAVGRVVITFQRPNRGGTAVVSVPIAP